MEDKNFIIYSLSSSENKDIVRYIGYTSYPIHRRLVAHISTSKFLKTHKDNWIQKELKNNNKIIITEIDSSIDVDALKIKEIDYIKLYKSFGAKLVNGTMGGDGCKGFKKNKKQLEAFSLLKSKRVYVFNYSTQEFMYEFVSIVKMITELKLSRSLVNKILVKQAKSYKGYTFNCVKEFPIFNDKNARR